MATPLIGALERELAARREAGLCRTRRTLDSPQGARAIVDGAEVRRASPATTTSGSRTIRAVIARRARGRLDAGASARAPRTSSCGHPSPHEALEARSPHFVAPAAARALLFSSGYLANLGDPHRARRPRRRDLRRPAQPRLPERRRAARRAPTSSATRTATSEGLAARLAASRARRKLIATDAVFSMDGDIAPLPACSSSRDAHDAWLVVDDAHGFGVLGRRARQRSRHFGLAVAAHRLHGHARQGGRRRRRVRRRASGGDRDARADARGPTSTPTAAPPMLACALAAALDAIRDGASRRARLAASHRRTSARARRACRGRCCPRPRRSSR